MKHIDFADRPGYVIDLETTGLDQSADEIIEIGLYDMQSNTSWSTLVRPERASANATTFITGITDDDVADAPRLPEAMRLVSEQIGTTTDKVWWVAHNGERFDYPWLNEAASSVWGNHPDGEWFPAARRVDTYPVSRWAIPDGLTTSRRLVHFIERFDFADGQTHRAGDDCENTAKLLEQCAGMLADDFDHVLPGQVSMRTLALMSQAPRPRITDGEKWMKSVLSSLNKLALEESAQSQQAFDVLARRYIARVREVYPAIVDRHPEAWPVVVRSLI